VEEFVSGESSTPRILSAQKKVNGFCVFVVCCKPQVEMSPQPRAAMPPTGQDTALARLLTYAATCAALPVLRRNNAPPALFRLRGGTVISVLALLLALWLLANSTLKEAITAAVAAAVGLVVYVTYKVSRRG
jgi:hypothetical protein